MKVMKTMIDFDVCLFMCVCVCVSVSVSVCIRFGWFVHECKYNRRCRAYIVAREFRWGFFFRSNVSVSE